MNIQWDAAGYTNNFSYVHQYGNQVIELLQLQEGQTVLDLGCGNGALTKQLSDLGFHATGLDASAELLEIARLHYPDLTFTESDATNFSLPQPVDAVFSNAVLHWIDANRQADMAQAVCRALKPGGQFVFEMGGKGNNDLIHHTLSHEFAKRGHAYEHPFFFPGIGQYAALLEANGFAVAYAVLFDRPTPLKGKDGLTDYIKMFIKKPFAAMPEDEKEDIIQSTVRILKPELFRDSIWYSDYVRLRMKAVRQ